MITRPWYDRLRFRLLILLGLYLLGVVGVSIALHYRYGYTDLSAIYANSTTIGILLPIFSPLGFLSLVALAVCTLRTESRRTVLLCYVGFTVALVLAFVQGTRNAMTSGW